VFVEGKYDTDFYRWELKNRGRRDISVYEIDTLEVPPQLLIDLGLSEGNRQNLIAASSVLVQDTQIHDRIMFLIDADCDYLLQKPAPARPLHRTVGTAAESIYSRKHVLARFIQASIGLSGADAIAKNTIDSIEDFLAKVSALRAVNEQQKQNWSFKKVSLQDTYDKKTKGFSFDSYCNVLAGNNSCHKVHKQNLAGWLQPIEEVGKKLPLERRVHGHDLVEAIGKFLFAKGNKEEYLKNGDTLGRLLFSSLQWEMVKDEPMLKYVSDTLP
jgi:hypothetical protein